MTIYSLNFGIGWASSGVEYAQKYRANILRELSIPIKFIFTDYFGINNIQKYTKNMGFNDEEIISIYNYFTDIKIAPSFYTLKEFLEETQITLSACRLIETKEYLIINDINTMENVQIRIFWDDYENEIIKYTEHWIDKKIMRRDSFTYTRTCSEYYCTESNDNKVLNRIFYNENGSVAFEEILQGDEWCINIHNRKLYSMSEFIGYFFESLRLTRNDIVLLDRSSGIGQAILENKGEAKIGVVVHAEHYNADVMDEDYILWNNYYEYCFRNAEHYDFFITSTNLQSELLRKQFKKYQNMTPKIYTLPVGNLDVLRDSKDRRDFNIITVSRLADEKKIDWLIKAVIIAKEKIRDLEFHIYGEGNQKIIYQKIIEQNNASHFIKLMGHQNMIDKYKNYTLYLSGSTSEGFGLTLMEAVGSGVGLIGLDVPYGNPTFINSGKNGYLIAYNKDFFSEEDIIQEFSKKIILFYNLNLRKVKETSYVIATQFLEENVKKEWENFINEVNHDITS
ncbi:accessory Sec system glycosyltransferase GtfA [Macrococcus capreoli]|uniref:accessory Sec system glycosyltransferase GtfA n=1 Tax=Macrococcus capreoli TaxID=2982690 RepID=UPI003EE6352A